MVYQGAAQTEGKVVHKKIDTKEYSTRKKILQNFEVFSSHYQIFGKLDLFDIENGFLSERKNNIKTIYDGYIFQLYAQYFGLTEMGYKVTKMALYDFSKNKMYPIELPENDKRMKDKFEQTLLAIRRFSLLRHGFVANKYKCEKCVYHLLCDASLC